MEGSDTPMHSLSDASPSTATASPSSSSPPPPPPLPPPPFPLLPPLLPPPPCHPQQTSSPLLSSYVGSLDSATRAALRQNKWPLILILPRHDRAPSNPGPRPAWGSDAYHAPKKLQTSPTLLDNILLWRRTVSSSDADRYTAFFPIDGLPHLALLDPRSGERLMVWGNVDGQGMATDGISDALWEQVQSDLSHFLEYHSLEDGALGPTHHQQKSWAVRTRRVSEKKSLDHNVLQSTLVMDDEDAAIAAAIAASLAEAREDSCYESGSDHVDEHDIDDDDSDDIFSADTSSQGDDTNDINTESDDFEQNSPAISDIHQASTSPRGVFVRLSSSLDNIPTPSRRPILLPSRGEPLPSSVESLSSSYLERMESCIRSSNNSALMETRRLRQEQDAELAASLQEDRQREEQERIKAEIKAAKKQAVLDAAARLPDEPAESADALVIAIRLPLGKRITRRFNSFDPLQSVADFAIAESGCVGLIERTPEAGLRITGVKLTGLRWATALRELELGSRTMINLKE